MTQKDVYEMSFASICTVNWHSISRDLHGNVISKIYQQLNFNLFYMIKRRCQM